MMFRGNNWLLSLALLSACAFAHGAYNWKSADAQKCKAD